MLYSLVQDRLNFRCLSFFYMRHIFIVREMNYTRSATYWRVKGVKCLKVANLIEHKNEWRIWNKYLFCHLQERKDHTRIYCIWEFGIVYQNPMKLNNKWLIWHECYECFTVDNMELGETFNYLLDTFILWYLANITKPFIPMSIDHKISELCTHPNLNLNELYLFKAKTKQKKDSTHSQ